MCLKKNDFKKLTHFQDTILKKKTPQLRAEFYGAINYLVGENVALTYFNTQMKSKTGELYINDSYDKAAFDIVNGWVHSPKHFANMITPDYQITGLALSVDSAKKIVYAVQTFAKVLWKMLPPCGQ